MIPTVRQTLQHAITEMTTDLENTEAQLIRIGREYDQVQETITVLRNERTNHIQLLESLEAELEERREDASHDVDVAPAHGIERPILGYDEESWNAPTRVARNIITQSNGAYDGMDADELEFNVMDTAGYGMGIAAHEVNWIELARFFGGET